MLNSNELVNGNTIRGILSRLDAIEKHLKIDADTTDNEASHVYIYFREYDELENRPYIAAVFGSKDKAEHYKLCDRYPGYIQMWEVNK